MTGVLNSEGDKWNRQTEVLMKLLNKTATELETGSQPESRTRKIWCSTDALLEHSLLHRTEPESCFYGAPFSSSLFPMRWTKLIMAKQLKDGWYTEADPGHRNICSLYIGVIFFFFFHRDADPVSSLKLFLQELAIQKLQHRGPLHHMYRVRSPVSHSSEKEKKGAESTRVDKYLTRCSSAVSSDFKVNDSNSLMPSWNPSTAASLFPRLLSTSATFARETATSRI